MVFKVLYDAVPWEGEFEFFFSDTDKTYMVIKYDDHVSFQRCGAGDGSGEYSYDSLMELFKTESVDGICLEKDWDKITAIVADATYDITDEEELSDYKRRIGQKEDGK